MLVEIDTFFLYNIVNSPYFTFFLDALVTWIFVVTNASKVRERASHVSRCYTIINIIGSFHFEFP